MRHYTALRLACVGGSLLVALGCGRVIEPGEEETVESGLCDPSEEWHVVDARIDERATQSVLWFDGGPIVATQFRDQGDNLSSLERFDTHGGELFRKDIDPKVNLLSPSEGGFLALGHDEGKLRRLALESHDGSGNWTWRVAFQTEEDVWPAAVYEVGDALLVIATQEPYSGADKDVVVYGLSNKGELRFTQVFGEDPPVIGKSSEERVVGSYAYEDQVVVVAQAWLDGSGGPLQVVALNAAGEALWRYSDSFEYARGTSWAVAPTSDGGALITGSPSAGGISTGSARLLRLDRDGRVLWEKTLRDAELEDPDVTGAVQLPNGDFFLTGSAWGPAAHSWRIDPNGEVIAVAAHSEEQLGGAPSFRWVELMPDGGVLLASETHSLGAGKLNLLRADSNGQALWQHTVDGQGIAFVSDLVVSPESQVVLAGRFAKEDSVDERHVLQLSDACQLEHARK